MTDSRGNDAGVNTCVNVSYVHRKSLRSEPAPYMSPPRAATRAEMMVMPRAMLVSGACGMLSIYTGRVSTVAKIESFIY